MSEKPNSGPSAVCAAREVVQCSLGPSLPVEVLLHGSTQLAA